MSAIDRRHLATRAAWQIARAYRVVEARYVDREPHQTYGARPGRWGGQRQRGLRRHTVVRRGGSGRRYPRSAWARARAFDTERGRVAQGRRLDLDDAVRSRAALLVRPEFGSWFGLSCILPMKHHLSTARTVDRDAVGADQHLGLRTSLCRTRSIGWEPTDPHRQVLHGQVLRHV